MKKINRKSVAAPSCLSKFNYLVHNWGDVNSRSKRSIWGRLKNIQNGFCVYCESVAVQGKLTGHIEHFFNKGNVNFKSLTFDWNNLFGCCQSIDHCGHYKDKHVAGAPRVYDATLLLKPDIDNPSDFLQFLYTGKIIPKDGLAEKDLNRAKVTIDVLNLDCSALTLSRKNKIENYTNRVAALDEAMIENPLDEDLYDELFNTIKMDATNDSHRTAVEQVVFNT